MRFIQGFLRLLGRFCIATIFVLAGLWMIFCWDQTLDLMKTHELPYTELLLIGAIIIEILGGIALAFGIRPKFAATVLALYLILETYTFHNFWLLTDVVAREQQMFEFLKNLAIFGGLVCYLGSPSVGAKEKEVKEKA